MRSKAPGALANLVFHTESALISVTSDSTGWAMGILVRCRASAKSAATVPNCSTQWLAGVYSWLSVSMISPAKGRMASGMTARLVCMFVLEASDLGGYTRGQYLGPLVRLLFRFPKYRHAAADAGAGWEAPRRGGGASRCCPR